MKFLAAVLGAATISSVLPAQGAFVDDTVPSMEELAITSGGSRINGLVYLAGGMKPRPVVIFLHGYPGNERNLDLAQATRRAGYQSIYIDYRGTWGSGGTFSFTHALEDVTTVLAWVRKKENADKFHFDTRRIALVGHSMGGWLSLMTAAKEPRTVCVAALAAWNVGWTGARFADHADERKANLDYYRETTDPNGGPVRAAPEDLIREMVANAGSWDYVTQARTVGDRAIFLAAASGDGPDGDIAMHERLEKALRAARNTRVSLLKLTDDHPFSAHRTQLAAALVQWLNGDCAVLQTAR